MKKIYLYLSFIVFSTSLYALTDAEIQALAKNCVDANFKLYALKSPGYEDERIRPEIEAAIADLETEIRAINRQISESSQKMQLLAAIVDAKNLQLLAHRMQDMTNEELRTYLCQIQDEETTDISPDCDVMLCITALIADTMTPIARAAEVEKFRAIDEQALAYEMARMKPAHLDEFRQVRTFRELHHLTMNPMALLPIARRILKKPIQENHDDDNEEETIDPVEQEAPVEDTVPTTNGLAFLLNQDYGDEENDGQDEIDMDLE